MNPDDKKPRPKLLAWLCIGSAIFGSSWIIMLSVLIIYSLKGQVPAGLFPGIVIEYLQAGYLFLAAEILLTAIGIAGVILMWQTKKTGFYLYAFTKAVIYFLPVVLIGENHLTFPALAITSVLIILYGTSFAAFAKK